MRLGMGKPSHLHRVSDGACVPPWRLALVLTRVNDGDCHPTVPVHPAHCPGTGVQSACGFRGIRLSLFLLAFQGCAL
jgi:hypothetical protein